MGWVVILMQLPAAAIGIVGLFIGGLIVLGKYVENEDQ